MDQRYLLGLITGVIIAWFALGIIYNLRRGEGILRWMRGGLPRLGERSTLRWLGSSVAEMVIERPKPPFRKVETLVVLAPRDAPWLWLWARLHGRRDTLIFRCGLPTQPVVAMELADPSAWTGRIALAEASQQRWESMPLSWPPGPLPGPAQEIAGDGRQPAARVLTLMTPAGSLGRGQQMLSRWFSVIGRLDTRPWRFALRRDPPLLEIHLPFPKTSQRDAAEYFEILRELGRAVMEVGH